MTRQPSIIFNAAMAAANLRSVNPKTATSRVIKGMPEDARCVTILHGKDGLFSVNGNNFTAIHCKYRVGQRLLVKEPWFCATGDVDGDGGIYHFRGGADPELEECAVRNGLWESDFTMPLFIARQAITITRVTVRRLEDIDEAGAWKEGFRDSEDCTARHNYLDAMRQIYKLRPEENPWVWQYDYTTERIERA